MIPKIAEVIGYAERERFPNWPYITTGMIVRSGKYSVPLENI